MKNRAAATSAVLLTILLGGCAETAEAPAEAQPIASLNAPVETTNVTSDWWLGRIELTNGTGYAGFVWDLPKDSYDVSLGGSIHQFTLEFVMLGDNATEIEEYGAILTNLDLRATYMGSLYAGHESYIVKGPLANEAMPAESMTAPRTLSIVGTQSDSQAKKIGMVLSARGNADEAWIAWRVISGADAAEPASTAAQFLADRKGPAQLLPPAGRGVQWKLAGYADLNALLTSGWEITLGQPVLTDALITPDLRPAATLRDVTMESNFAEDGWSRGFGVYLGTDGAARWNVEVDNQGTTLSMQDGIWTAGPNLLAILLLGLPGFVVEGDGVGGAAMNFQLELVNVNRLELMVFEHVALDQTMAQIFGIQGASTGALTGSSPIFAAPDGTLHLSALGRHLVVEP